MEHRVVVTGLGTISPCGNTVGDTWAAMLAGRSGISAVTRFKDPTLRAQAAGEVKDFDGPSLLGRKLSRRVGLFMQYAIVAADQAMAHAGFDRDEGVWPDVEEFGVCVASGIGGIPEIVKEAYRCRDEGSRRVSPFFIPRSLSNLAAGHLAIRYTAGGPALCHATACAAGNHSIGEAARMIRLGEASVILAGGAEAAISQLSFAGFANMKALSTRKDNLSAASRPFDAERDGFVMGEGAGILVLESLEHAKGRGATILAELVGYAATNDAYHITAPPVGGTGAANCMRRAMRAAGLAVTDIDYLNAHGTSTKLNDKTETAAIRAVFGAHADKLLVSSTKGVTGHLLGAAGGVEAVATVMALRTGWVPQTANLTNADPDCDLDYVAGESRKSDPKIAMSNGFGFGGTNAVVIFRRWEV